MGLDTVELILAMEKRFSIRIPNEVAPRLATVGHLHQFVVEQLRHQESQQLTPDEVYSIMADIICDQLGVRREDVVPDANFVYHLGAD